MRDESQRRVVQLAQYEDEILMVYGLTLPVLMVMALFGVVPRWPVSVLATIWLFLFVRWALAGGMPPHFH